MIHESKSMAINENSALIPHHKNGFQNYCAIMALSALTGNFDRKGDNCRESIHLLTRSQVLLHWKMNLDGTVEPKDAVLPVGATFGSCCGIIWSGDAVRGLAKTDP